MVTLSDVIALVQPIVAISDNQVGMELKAIAPLDSAVKGQLSFLASAKYRRQLEQTKASAVLVTEKEAGKCPPQTLAVVVKDPYLAYAQVSQLFDLTPRQGVGVHPSAVIDASAVIGDSVRIGANSYIGANVVLGSNVEIAPNCSIDEFAKIGNETRLGFGVVISHRCEVGASCLIQHGTVIGSKGFGYAPTENGWEPIAQLGKVIIGDRVEIGANCTIDRGAIDNTIIKDDVIIDNLVHIAHNVVVGKRTALAGQVGIAGSTNIGESCTAGGQVGINGHISIADNSHFMGQAMITKGTTEAGVYASGIPAQDAREWRKMVARIRQLESMQSRLKEIEKLITKEGME
jgi:UDP-3-O-[3-hydroxymyristoyl] glucosamine N-acyltransferase